MKKYIYLFLILSVSISYGQGLSVKFLESEFDFGHIEEAGGKVSHEFSFINMGQLAVAIVSVNAECGCTTPSWTENNVMPGDTGIVQAEYDPYDQPGKFNKKLTVKFTNSEESILKLSGIVLPRVKSNAEEELPEVMGCLLFKSNYIHLAKVTNEKRVEKRVKFYNNCDHKVAINEESLIMPEHIEFKFNALEVEPKSYSAATLIFDPIQKASLGYSRDDISFSTNEDTLALKELIATAQVQYYFPSMTQEELSIAPKVYFDTVEFNYGTKPLESTINHSFTFSNKGEKELEILEIQAACNCVDARVSNSKINKGESATIDVVFDGKGRSGRQVKTVIVYTNDPKNSIITLKITGKLK